MNIILIQDDFHSLENTHQVCVRGVIGANPYPRHIPVPPTFPATNHGGNIADTMTGHHWIEQSPSLPLESLVIPTLVQSNLMTEAAQIHAKNITISNERRLKAAKAEGNFSLVELLEIELAQAH